jgi:hypothetical protein
MTTPAKRSPRLSPRVKPDPEVVDAINLYITTLRKNKKDPEQIPEYSIVDCAVRSSLQKNANLRSNTFYLYYLVPKISDTEEYFELFGDSEAVPLIGPEGKKYFGYWSLSVDSVDQLILTNRPSSAFRFDKTEKFKYGGLPDKWKEIFKVVKALSWNE